MSHSPLVAVPSRVRLVTPFAVTLYSTSAMSPSHQIRSTVSLVMTRARYDLCSTAVPLLTNICNITHGATVTCGTCAAPNQRSHSRAGVHGRSHARSRRTRRRPRSIGPGSPRASSRPRRWSCCCRTRCWWGLERPEKGRGSRSRSRSSHWRPTKSCRPRCQLRHTHRRHARTTRCNSPHVRVHMVNGNKLRCLASASPVPGCGPAPHWDSAGAGAPANRVSRHDPPSSLPAYSQSPTK